MRRLNMALLVGLASRLVEDAAWGRVVDLLDSNMQQQKEGNISGGWLMYEFHTNRVPVRLDESKLEL